MTQDQWIKLSTGEEKHVNIQLSPFQKAVETSHSISKPTPEIVAPSPPGIGAETGTGGGTPNRTSGTRADI